MATIADVHYLFVGLGDGHVVSFPLEVTAESGLVLGTPKKVALGTQPVGLACFRNNGMVCVFVASDRPAVIYCSGGKLLYANVNMGEVCVAILILSPYCRVEQHGVCGREPSVIASISNQTKLVLVVLGRSTPCARSTLVHFPSVWRWRVKAA